MATSAANLTLASQARRLYTEELVKGLANIARAVHEAARSLIDKPAEYTLAQRRRDMFAEVHKGLATWHRASIEALRKALAYGMSATRAGDLPPPGTRAQGSKGLSLVDDDTIEREICTSRLSLAIMDSASWEFTDLRARIASLERREELDPHDMLRAHVLARIAVEAWRAAGMQLDTWRELQGTLHDEFANLVCEAYHEANRWLMERGVLPEVDLRPMIRRAQNRQGGAAASSAGDVGDADRDGPLESQSSNGGRDHAGRAWSRTRGRDAEGAQDTVASWGARDDAGGNVAAPGARDSSGNFPATGGRSAPGRWSGGGQRSGGERVSRPGGHDETRLMTRPPGLAGPHDHAQAVLGRLNRLIGRHAPGFGDTGRQGHASPALDAAITRAETGIREEFDRVVTAAGGEAQVTTPALLHDLAKRKQALKQAAETPVERATIEIVALLFQSILTEERIPAAVRVWFARLQMPVLRVAIGEPDFFATVDHPARRLIDRMGACVMGFDASARLVGDALEKEIKRVVQVVEAYPDTGRRVFQTVLTEFERFLEHYFKNENEATRKGVSLAQQVEQRETLAIQYTIELRKMLEGVPVQEGVRQFLFQVWADVLAMTAVKFGPQSDGTKTMKRAAADLIWSAGAKVSREERAEVIRRLPPLLKTLREGMGSAGLSVERQDDHIQKLNNSLAAAFTAKAAAIPSERLEELMEQLETLEEMLPEAVDIQIDESMMLDLSGHESSELEVVSEGGSTPTPAMLAWARELQVGSWYMLDFRGRTEAVQLAWHGLRRQLSLFVTPVGRCVLFQQQRLAAFLQAGLLLPAQDEALTVRATRTALAKLDVDPSRLLS
ncbi:MAG TPA: DUF1631 family protein [Burkholderiaceae bacterium]|nr:DUF1631 family protein [Burkholderiaceae bacterium]